jgi:hypothetical protein
MMYLDGLEEELGVEESPETVDDTDDLSFFQQAGSKVRVTEVAK